MKKITMSLMAALAIAALATAQPNTAPKKAMPPRNGANKEIRPARPGGPERQRLGPQNNLNLSEEQKSQIKKASESFRQKMRELNAKEDITVKQQRDERQALNKAYREQVNAIYTPEQKAKLDKMRAGGRNRFGQTGIKQLEHIKGKLSLTDEQLATIKAGQEQQKGKLEAIMKNEALSREEKRKQLDILRDEVRKKLENVLTQEQREKFDQMRQRGPGMHRPFRPRHSNWQARPAIS